MGTMSEIEFDYPDVAAVRISGLGSGDVTVDEADGTSVSGRIAGGRSYLDRLQINQTDRTLRIDLPRNEFGEDGECEIELRVPAGTDFQLTSGSADVVSHVALGATKVNTGSGDINLASVTDAKLSTGSGDIVIGDIGDSVAPEDGPSYVPTQLNSGSGDISVGATAGPLQAKTASGDISVLRLTGALKANTASGDISVPSLSGTVELNGASGNISVGVADDLPAWLELSSISGEVNIDLDASEQPAEGEPYVAIKASTASGDISVYRA